MRGITSLLSNAARYLQWTDVMRQLRPAVTPEAISDLIPWRYHFVTSLQDDKVVGAGAYFPTASLVRGRYNYLADLVVDSKYRSKGVGASMMREVLASNVPCELDSGLQRTDAHRFYRRLGFDSPKYAVRLKSDAFAVMGDWSKQQTYLIDGVHYLQKQHESQLKDIQKFVDKYTAFKVPCRANLQLFMRDNPEHRLLTLRGKTGAVEGIMLFEPQNRLYIGGNGNCFYVSDLIVKDGPGAIEKQNSLLLSLTQKAREHNLHNSACPVQSVIIEMTEQEARNHKLLEGDRESKSTKPPEDKIVNPLTKKLNVNSFFSVTAKHFVRVATPNKDKEQLPLGDWYQQLRKEGLRPK